MRPLPGIESMRISSLLAFLFIAVIPPALAQGNAPANDPNQEHPNQVVTASLKGYTIAGLVTHLKDAKAFKHGIALFPGYPGIMKLREENGRPRFDLGGNFLVRSRRHWLDGETLVVVVDAPSNQWASFTQAFRESPQYADDVEALLKEVSGRFSVQEWTFVGTSEGSVSAFHAARFKPQLARRVILTSSVLRAGRNGAGLSAADWSALSAPLLWVHHENDPCEYTSYRDAQRAAEKSRSPLVTVRGGGPARGDFCQAFTAHGFVGVEQEAVEAMRTWVRTGAVPPDAGRQ